MGLAADVLDSLYRACAGLALPRVRALHLPEPPGRPILEVLALLLRDEHRLLILDNCEHLLEACVQLVDVLCTYSERLYYEQLYPAALDWWWEYRVNYYQPSGWYDISVYDVPQEFGFYRRYRDPVYLHGVIFLEELRTVIGDSAFFAAFRQYVEQYAYRQSSSAGFLEAIRQYTTADLQALLEKYFLTEN